MVESLETRAFLQIVEYLKRTLKYILNIPSACLPNRQNMQKSNGPLFTWTYTVSSGWGAVCMASFAQEQGIACFLQYLFILQQLKSFQRAVNENCRDIGLSWIRCTIPQAAWVKISIKQVHITVFEGCLPYLSWPRQHISMLQSKRHAMRDMVFLQSWLLGAVEVFKVVICESKNIWPLKSLFY